MRGTSILNIKAWPKIHQPLPRTPRESQQLLSALTSSFRRQLDAADSNKPAESAERHLKTILDNPLFRVVPSKPAHLPGNPHGQKPFKKRLAEEPMAVFDDLAASGSITGNDIAECLRSQLALIGSTSGDADQAMKSSGAGARVVSWFWASDSASRKTLFKSRRATSAALKFMAAEGLQDTIMVWLRMLSKRDLGGLDGQIPELPARRLFNEFLADFMASEIRYGRGIASALGYFLQASQMCSLLTDQPSRDLTGAMLWGGAGSLGRYIIKNSQSQEVKEVPVPIYDRFCEVMTTLTCLPFLTAAVWLYHPTQPTAELLLAHVKQHPPETVENWTEAKRDNMIRVYLDAFRLLLDQEKYRDASWLAPYIRQLLSDDSVKASKRTEYSVEQDELVSRLDLALA
ncbi:hypothetical protein VTN77DRAFT_1867 [Rasamsonia byssochlamydoides]|uniref:uncharacterized protein n=1 Tax=Rasamsonia byssochlamydoides TaxID=89139 RepID=UPI0037448F79